MLIGRLMDVLVCAGVWCGVLVCAVLCCGVSRDSLSHRGADLRAPVGLKVQLKLPLVLTKLKRN
jgi:hypothetical protein